MNQGPIHTLRVNEHGKIVIVRAAKNQENAKVEKAEPPRTAEKQPKNPSYPAPEYTPEEEARIICGFLDKVKTDTQARGVGR